MAFNGGWRSISEVTPVNNQNVQIIARYFSGVVFPAVYQANNRRFATTTPNIFFNNPDVIFWRPL
jgi:hypothetical protein